MSNLERSKPPIRLEVTGTDSPNVPLQAPLWILEGKARYAEEHPDEEIYIVHVLDTPRLKRPIIRALRAKGLLGRYPIEIKRPYGAPERYLVVPVTAPEIMREEVFMRLLKERCTPLQQQLSLFGAS
ncbi:MAG TPA: hypothetical protein V6D05_13745 [Stenomitos sp.]